MFTDEDSKEDDGAGGQTRYPVMPSLVALQQMKNRLHLAFLGKKLMKWTAMATSKELRKLAAEINRAFENYGAEFAKAFMLLARCRYYHPDMNTIVVHNVSKQAASIVQFDYRSVAGVKVVELELIEKGFDPNEHLGIARGGSTIQETKKCWRDLLRLAVLMLQQRTAFKMLYDANKSATKKQNVLAKLVIPKIQKAIAYINAELEEREREETFRLKRFKQKKDKKAVKTKEVINLDEEPYVEAEPDIIVEKPPQKSCACALAHPNQFTDEEGNFDCPICKLADKNVAIKIAPCTLCLPAVKEAEHRLKHLMAHVNQVLLLSKQYLLAETAPCCKENGNENEGGELNYAGLKKQLEFISVTCTCPHKEPDIQSDGSCTCKPPCRCDEPPKFKDCCGGPEKADVERSGSEFQTYNLCSIYGSSSCPQSMATGSNFRNSSKNYPAVPPFFYLYSGPYVRSETGFHSIQSKSAKASSKKGLDAAPCKNELIQVKPPCPCAPMDEKKICSCEALSPQQSEHPCVCNSTEIIPTQNPPSRQSEAVGVKGTCPSCQVVTSLHAPNPATDLAKRITRVSEPCIKIKLSVSGYLPVTKSVDPETAKKSENNLKPDTRFNPIKRANANLEVTTSSLRHLEDDNNTQTKTCSCKSMVKKVSSEIISQQSSEDLCSCGSTETLVPIVLQSSIDHYNALLAQSDVVEMICKGIFQTDQPATSLPPPTLSIELAERVAKASEPYLKKKISLNKAYPVDEIEEIPKYPACFLKSVMSKKSTCSCESPEQTKSCSCKSMQSCPCGVSDESSRGSNSSEDLSNTTSGPPYFKRPATFFTAVPQKFTPLISYTQEKNIGPYDCRNMTDSVLLRGTSISNDFADQYLTFNPYTRDQNYKNHIFSETCSITGSFNKIFSKQAAYLSPYTREGKPGPCGISEVSYVACPLSNTVSKQSSAYTTYLLKENSAYFPTYTQVGKQVLCSHSQVSSMGATLDDIDSLSSCMASYTAELKSEYCDISETGSITNEFYVIDSKQCTTSLTYTLAENAAITEIDKTSKSLDATACKDFSIYMSMNHQKNVPYMVYTQQCNNACGSRERTDLPGTPKCKDCSTYVTVIRKRPVPYTREGRPGPCGVCEMVYQTYFVISEDCATYVTTVPKKNPEEQPCGSLSTITTSSSPFSISYATCSNCDTLLPQKEKIDECSICRIVKLSRQLEDFAPFTQSSEYSDNLTLNNDIDLSDSEIYKICNACNPIPKHIEPYTREGIPGPCGVDEENDNVGNQGNVNIIPYTREEIAKLCGVSETNTIVRSLTNRPCTGEGISQPCGISDTCNIDNCSCNSDTKPIPNVKTCIQERKPGSCKVPDTNNIADSRCNAAPKCLIDIKPCTQEATRPCGFTKINHTEDADSIKVRTDVGGCTRKKKPGPCCGSCCIPETFRHTGATCISIPKTPPYVGVYAQERTPRSCCVSEPNPNAGATCMKTPKILPDVGAFKREGKLRPSCLSEPNQNAGATCMKIPRTLPCDEAYTRKGTPGPCCLSETNQNAGATCINTSKILPDVGAFKREGKLRPSCLSEPNQNAGVTCMKIPRTLPCDEAYTQKETPGPCCLSETNQNAGATCMNASKILPDVGAFKREGKLRPSCLSEPNQNAGATCMKIPRTLPCDEAYTRKGTPGPCCLSETNQNAGATCMNTPKILPDVGAFKREGKLRPSCLSEPNQNAGSTCMKIPRTLPCDEAYTRKGTPGPCCLSETNQNAGATCMNASKILPDVGAFKQEGKLRPSCLSEPNQNAGAICMKTPRTLPCDEAYTRKGTPGPCCLSEINQDADATCMRTTKMPTEVGAFTREGTPGPCGISRTNSNAGAMSMKIPRPLPCDKAYTREGAPGPCGVSNTNHIEGLNSNRVPETVPGGKVNTQEGTQELKVPETNKTAVIPESQPTSNNEPNTHEDTQKKTSSATNKDQVIGFLYNTTIHPSLDIKSNRNAGSVRYTVRKLLSHLRPSTRETTPMPCSIPETSHIAGVNSIRVPEILPGILENAREGISGPYGVTETNKITSSVCSEDSQPPSNVELHTREETRGPYGISNKDHIVGYFYNTPLKPSSDFRAYTREDIPDRCVVSKTNSNAGSSSTARELLSDLGPYTVEKIPRLCGSSETIAGSRYYTVNNPILNVNPQDENPGPCCISDTNYIADSRWMTSPKRPSNVEQYTRQGKSVSSGNSEINNITDFFFNTTPKSFEETSSHIQETTSGSQGIFDTDHIAGANSIMVSEAPSAIGAYTREETSGSRDIAKTNGVTSSIRNMIPKFFSRPYTQVGIPRPCGVSEKGYNLRSRANSIPKGSTNVKPYTRENQPGPCGISYEASNSSFSVTSSSNRMLENKSRRWNNSRIYKNGTSQLCKLESFTRQENRGPYCETQSCMMCLTTPCNLEGLTRHTGNHNTKDAITYVTLVPRLVSCTREAVPGSCSTCKTRNTHQAESSKSSAYSCKARAPHIRINDTRSLHSIFPASCSSCKPPATASEATSMLLPSYIFAIPSSTKTSGTCYCKSSRLSTATLGCGPSYNESERYIAPKKGCSICGRSASKLNTHMMSVSYLTSVSHGNSDTVGSTSLKSQPCSGCGKATLVMSCASNPSVKSVAIGTCETYFASSKRNPIPKLSTKSSHCHFGKTKAIQQCCNKDIQNSSSEESTTSSESENCTSEDCKTSEKRKEDTGELGFGYFEIAFKKITKICKYKNPDGTVTDEKRIITVETTKKRPQTSEDLDIEEGTSIGCSLENETNSIANNNNCKCKSVRNAKSETVQGNVEIDVCPKIRRCISVQNCKNVKEPIIIVPKSCITNSLLKCPHRLHDSDNDSKCKCDKKSNENARRSFEKSTSAPCLSKQQDACTVVRTKNHQSNDSKTKCQGGNAPCLVPTRKICPKRYKCLDDNPKSDCAKSDHKSTTSTCTDEPQDTKSEPKCSCTNKSQSEPAELEDSDSPCAVPSRKICPKRYECLDDTPKSECAKSDHKSTTSTCTDEPQDIKSKPKCSCTNNSQPEPTESEDSDGGPKCDFTSRQVQESHDKEQQTHDSGSAKCKPTPNKPEDSENGPKCDCVKKSESKPTPPVCCRQEDTETEPKCECAKARKSFSKTTAPICPNSIQVTGSKPADNVVFLVPSGQICTNSFQVLDNSPMSDCACKSLQKLIAPICVHGLQDTKSGPKCSCAKKATSKPVCQNRLKDSDSSPKHICPNLQPKPAPVCGLKSSDAACNNILQKTDSDIKCEYLNKMLHKSTSPVCVLKQQNECTGVCGNPQKVSENEPKFKFEDGNAVLIVPTIKTCTDNCESKSHRKSSTPISTVKPQDTKTEKKCSCRKSQSKPTVPVCSNKQHESDSSPKCKCGNKSPPKSSVPVCPNKMDDIDSEPKCTCANKTPSKPTPPVCANRLADSDSGPKCDCPNETPKPTAPGCDHKLEDPNSCGPKCDCVTKTPPKSLPPVCANRLEDSDSGPKCDCPNETPKPTTPDCANRIEDTDSGPKCDCASHPSNPVSNNKKNSGCDPMCELASKILPMLVSKGQPDNNKVTNRKAKGTEDNFIFLALTGKGCTISSLKPTAPEYANRLEDSDNSSECNCENQSPPKTSNSLCTNKLEDSCECVSKSLPEFNKPICTNCYQVSDSEPKNYEGNNVYVTPTVMTCVSDNDSKSKSLPKLSTPICTTWQQDKDKTKNCANKFPCKTTTPVCSNRIEDTDSGSKCDCIKKAPKSTVPMCGDRLEDSDSGDKCACAKKSPPEPIAPICANRLQNSDSGSKCECADVTPSVKDTETETALDLRNAVETSDNSNKLPAIKLQNDKEAGRVLDLHDVKGDGNREEKTQDKEVSSSPQEVAGVLDLHDENDKDNSEEKLPSAKTQDYKLPAVTLQNEKVGGRVLDLHDVKGDGNREEKTQDKEVSCSPQEEGGRVLDLHNLKDNCNHDEPSTKLQNQEREGGGNKLLSTKTQDRKISCSSLQRETGIVIDLNDLKEIEKEEICTCKNVCKCDKSRSKKPEEAGRVINLNNCKCKTGLLSATAQIQEIYGILHGIVGKVIDTHGIKENRNSGSKVSSAKRQNKEVCCSLQPEKGIIVDLRDKKDKRNLDKKTHSITCHGGSGMVLNLNNGKDNCKNRLNEYTVPSKRTLCKPIQKTDIAMSTTDLYSKPKATCVPTSTKIDSNSCCPVKIIPKPRKICCCTAAHDASKLSIFKGVSMMDALRQLFQHSNSRTQKEQDKNICKACYSPLSNSDEVECLCDNCKEKLIDENERHYRCTNYSTEPGTPCKSAPSPLSHRLCFSKNNFRSNTEDRQCYHTPFAIKTPSMDSNTCLNCAEHDSCCNDVATSTQSRDISYVRIIKKGKIEHGCTKCGTRDGESHSRHKS